MTAAQSPKIVGFYQCYQQPKAFLKTVTAFRENYVDSPLVLYSDNGYNYQQIANSINAEYHQTTERTSSQRVGLHFDAAEKILGWLTRLLITAEKYPNDFILLLEDDVLCLRPVSVETLRYDVNGIGEQRLHRRFNWLLHKRAHSPVPLAERLSLFFDRRSRYRRICGCCGGSILRAAPLCTLKQLPLTELIEQLIAAKVPRSSDTMLSALLHYNNASFGGYDGFVEAWYSDVAQRLLQGKVATLHQFKYFYDQPLNNSERLALGEFA
jgi:hypothetical protein